MRLACTHGLRRTRNAWNRNIGGLYDLIQASFDYDNLPAETAVIARSAAERIKLRLKRTVEDIIEIGRELIEVRPRLDGHFESWFKTETGLDRQMAYKFIAAADKFGNGMYNNYTSLSPTIIYLLSAPSTPDSVIQQALDKAESGDKVTVSDVKDWKTAYEEEKQRSGEWKEQSQDYRKRLEQTQIELLNAYRRLQCQLRLNRVCNPSRNTPGTPGTPCCA